MYLWELPDWPRLYWDDTRLREPLSKARHNQGLLLGRMEALGFELQKEASLRTLTLDVVKTSEIEGERLDPASVRSSIARRLGMDIGGLPHTDRSVDGIVEITIDATTGYEKPLTKERLFAWHAALFPTGRSGMKNIAVGNWRDDHDGPMEVVSGPVGKTQVHFSAPPAARVDGEIAAFLEWFEATSNIDQVLKAGIAHLWFVTVHPFEDGNGRIARAVADMALARSDKTRHRFYSMSSQIRNERNEYYDILERTQKGALDVTGWTVWFLECFSRAVVNAQQILAQIIEKSRFWEKHRVQALNQRQMKVLNRLLDGFEGKLTTSKWAAMTKSSQDTAYRDILDLVEKGILVRDPAGGRSTSYSLATD